MSYKWNNTVCSLLRLASFTQNNVTEIYASHSVSIVHSFILPYSISLYGCTISHLFIEATEEYLGFLQFGVIIEKL